MYLHTFKMCHFHTWDEHHKPGISSLRPCKNTDRHYKSTTADHTVVTNCSSASYRTIDIARWFTRTIAADSSNKQPSLRDGPTCGDLVCVKVGCSGLPDPLGPVVAVTPAVAARYSTAQQQQQQADQQTAVTMATASSRHGGDAPR